jgi:hypothetical protein
LPTVILPADKSLCRLHCVSLGLKLPSYARHVSMESGSHFNGSALSSLNFNKSSGLIVPLSLKIFLTAVALLHC